MHFGNSGQADLKTLLGLFQLVSQRIFFCQCCFERVYRAKNIKISFGNTHNQTLLICTKLCLSLLAQLDALFVGVPPSHVKQRLLQGNSPACLFAVYSAGDVITGNLVTVGAISAIAVVIRISCTSINLWQEASAI